MLLAFRTVCLLASLLLLGCQQPADQNSKQTANVPTNGTPRSTATLPATQLQQAYEMNEVKADEVLKGKYLTVKGIVERVAKDILNQPYVTLKTDGLMGIQCTFSEANAGMVMDLLPGQKVAILGRCEGRTIGIVSLDDCSIAR